MRDNLYRFKNPECQKPVDLYYNKKFEIREQQYTKQEAILLAPFIQAFFRNPARLYGEYYNYGRFYPIDYAYDNIVEIVHKLVEAVASESDALAAKAVEMLAEISNNEAARELQLLPNEMRRHTAPYYISKLYTSEDRLPFLGDIIKLCTSPEEKVRKFAEEVYLMAVFPKTN